jgi:hypothetical protein
MRIFLAFIILFCARFAFGQAGNSYDSLVARAGLLHLQKDYKSSITCFEKAFAIRKPDALNAYKAAGVYALDSNAIPAFKWLHSALDNGWTEADWLLADPYFDYLRQAMPEQWKEVEKTALLKESQYESTLKQPGLRREINRMALNDQQLRYKRAQLKDRVAIRAINREIKRSDSLNLIQGKKIILQYEWPGLSDIGYDGQNNLWLIVQHADNDVAFQQEALRAMEKLKKAKQIRLDNYAFLYDRVQCNLNYKQLFGTQVIWTHNGQASGFRPILEEDRVDKRRKELNLPPLDIYAVSYGFTYKKKPQKEALRNHLDDVKKVRGLIDSAFVYYKLKAFDKVYQLYNSASEIPSGMSFNDNYKAAVLFCKISAITNEEQHRSIALDFLNLLLLRRQLNLKKLKAESSFRVLYDERRWADICKKLE